MIQELETERLLLDLIAFAASNDPDTLYYHQAMKEPDREEFIRAIVTEINGHVEGEHWELVNKRDVPKGTKILDSVWAFKQKRAGSMLTLPFC